MGGHILAGHIHETTADALPTNGQIESLEFNCFHKQSIIRTLCTLATYGPSFTRLSYTKGYVKAVNKAIAYDNGRQCSCGHIPYMVYFT